MFDLFKSGEGKNEDAGLTSLDLRIAPTSPSRPAQRPEMPPAPKAAVQPAGIPPCVQISFNLEGAHAHFNGAHRKFQESVRVNLKPAILFYLVFPQQGHSYSFTTADGSETILPIFTARPMADAYLAARKIGAVAASCRIENLSAQTDHWIASGINSYTLNLCCRCLSSVIFPISELQSEDFFLNTWRLDLANRRQFAEAYGRNASKVFVSNRHQARVWLEGIRDHIDPANPYLHWMIALLAGLAGDMEANAASIERLNAFGPPFTGKLQGTSFDPAELGSQMTTMVEAVLGLGVSLGYLDPNKLQKK